MLTNFGADSGDASLANAFGKGNEPYLGWVKVPTGLEFLGDTLKVIEITVKFSVKTEEEGQRIMSALGVVGDQVKEPVVEKVKKAVEPYTPLSERTRMALEALKLCKRVSVLREEVLEVWANAYPHANLAGEIAKCEAWAESKGVTRTPRGWQKALNSWLSKAQDSTRGNTYNPTIAPKVAAPVVVEAETEAWLKAAA